MNWGIIDFTKPGSRERLIAEVEGYGVIAMTVGPVWDWRMKVQDKKGKIDRTGKAKNSDRKSAYGD